MSETTRSTQREALKALPSVDALLRTETALALREAVGARHLATLARMVLEEIRAALQAVQSQTEQDGRNDGYTREALLAQAALGLERACRIEAEGQAIAWDRSAPDVLWQIVRSRREVVAQRLLGG